MTSPGEYDVVLFTRSLHHADDLDDILGHAATLLAPGGQIVIEEFTWERMDHIGADFLYDMRVLLVAAGLLAAELPSGDLLDAWIADHDFLHPGTAILAALDRTATTASTVDIPMLWRLISGRGGTWTEPATTHQPCTATTMMAPGSFPNGNQPASTAVGLAAVEQIADDAPR